jgi:hypothetical protein
MNTKRYVIAAIVLFVFIYIYEAIVHGMLLMPMYLETPNLWRGEMTAYLPFNIAIIALLALWITFIFTRFYREGGARNGLHFGFYLGLLSGIQAAGAYYYLPISAALAGAWFLANLIESVVGGLIIGAIYHRKHAL